MCSVVKGLFACSEGTASLAQSKANASWIKSAFYGSVLKWKLLGILSPSCHPLISSKSPPFTGHRAKRECSMPQGSYTDRLPANLTQRKMDGSHISKLHGTRTHAHTHTLDKDQDTEGQATSFLMQEGKVGADSVWLEKVKCE